jgi:archaellum component FlaC
MTTYLELIKERPFKIILEGFTIDNDGKFVSYIDDEIQRHKEIDKGVQIVSNEIKNDIKSLSNDIKAASNTYKTRINNLKDNNSSIFPDKK